MAAIVAGVTRVAADWWPPLHLFVVGGLLSAISATTQMLPVTWSAAAAPPHRRLVAAAQRWTLAVGAVALVVGRETDRTWVFVAGGTTVVAAMLVEALILVRIWRQAVTDRLPRAGSVRREARDVSQEVVCGLVRTRVIAHDSLTPRWQ